MVWVWTCPANVSEKMDLGPLAQAPKTRVRGGSQFDFAFAESSGDSTRQRHCRMAPSSSAMEFNGSKVS